MGVRELSDELNRTPIQTVASWVGVRLPLRGTSRCPFPDHPDKDPSFEIRPSGVWWVCYGCGRSGGSIDFVQTYQQCNFTSARDWLATRAGLKTSPVKARRSVSAQVPKVVRVPQESVEKPVDIEIYSDFLSWCPIQLSGKTYLNSRGISDQTISACRSGQIGKGQDTIKRLIQKYDFERVANSGLLSKASSKAEARCIFPDESVLFPYFDGDCIVYFQSRNFEGATKDNKWRNLNHRRRRTFKIQAETPSRPLAICEGVVDALSAFELQYDGWGLIGVSAELDADEIKLLRGREVHILLDWDAAGENRAKSLQSQLRTGGVSSVRKGQPMPFVKDLNDYLMKKRGIS